MAMAQSADSASASGGGGSGGEGQTYGQLPLTGFAYNDGSH
jgi:hypothetical protein